MKRVIVHIDRLVLKGFDRQDRDAIAEGLRSELGALLANAGASQYLTDMQNVRRLSVGSVQIGHDAKPGQVGQLIAGEIAKGGRR